MATTTTSSAEAIAAEFAAAVRDEPVVRQLWLRCYPERIELLLITDEADDATELRLFEAFATLIERHPSAAIRPRLLNPIYFEPGTDLVDQLPSGSHPIPLRG